MTDTYLVALNCGHYEVRATGQEQWEAYCSKCGDMRVIIAHHLEFVVRCYKCMYSRRFGAAKISAERAMSQHSNKYNHQVRIVLGDRVVSVLRPRNATNDDNTLL